MRLSVALLLSFVLVGSVRAERLQLYAQGTTGFTYNDNITLSKADVNFGPGVLGSSDLIGNTRLRTTLRYKTTELAYQGSRSRFFINENLGFAENILELNHEKLFPKQLLIQFNAQFARVDPDELVAPDLNGGFPFTTSEPPDRQILALTLSTPPGPPTELSVRALKQDQQYSNNPFLDADAEAIQAKVNQKINTKFSGAAEAQKSTRVYPNLVGPEVGSILRTNTKNQAAQVQYIPNAHFGFLFKSLWLNQYANVDAFFLDQEDVSLAASWEDQAWGNVSFLSQKSKRVFPRRVTPAGGAQIDKDLILVLQVIKRLGARSSLIAGYTYDRNRSNIADFDYTNNIVRVEFSRSF